MAACTSVCVSGFTVASLLFVAICHSAEAVTAKTGRTYFITVQAVTAKTVEADKIHCGKMFTLGRNVDTYRVVMPEGVMCQPQSASFECSIRFQLNQEYFLPAQICVDYARMGLNYKDTTILIESTYPRHPYDDIWERLTTTWHPRARSSMNTVKCFSFRTVVNVTFTAECQRHAVALRNFFSSWLYVYSQPAHDQLVFNVDGTCRHRHKMQLYYKLTIRSFIWQDTANEAKHQNCSLVLTSDSGKDTYEKRSVCSKWEFSNTSCHVSAHLRQRVLGEDFGDRGNKSFICKTVRYAASRYTGMDGCVPISNDLSAVFEVRRDEDLAGDPKIPDGALFFETNASVNSQYEERKDVNTYIYTSSDDDKDSNLLVKVLLPIAAVFGICACLCGIRRRMSNNEESECAATPRETAVSQPLVAPPGIAVHQPYSSETGWGGGEGRRSDGRHGDGGHGDGSHVDVRHGNVRHGDGGHGVVAGHGHGRHGDGRHGSGSHVDVHHGNVRHGDGGHGVVAGHGHGRHGDGRHGSGSHVDVRHGNVRHGDGGHGDRTEGRSMAAPPPDYDHFAHIAPTADDEAPDFRSSAADTAPSAPELSSSSGDSDIEIPPPPFNDDRPAAPPAYHDLFPSNS